MFRFLMISSVLYLLALPAAQALPDPTRPSSYRSAASESVNFHLESILFGEQRRVAVINGKVVAEGDSISGATVISIGRQNVRINRSGTIIELSPRRTSIRRKK